MWGGDADGLAGCFPGLACLRAWLAVRLMFIPAQVLSVFELALPASVLEPQAVRDVCPRALKPMSWRLGRENVSLSFWVNSMSFPRG